MDPFEEDYMDSHDDEDVIDRDSGHRIDALGLQSVEIVEEARQMLGVAGRRIGAGDREGGDGLAGEHVRGRHVGWTVVGHDLECRIGQAVANADRHGILQG